jgi:DNA-binding GntR family transcriptional regulator
MQSTGNESLIVFVLRRLSRRGFVSVLSYVSYFLSDLSITRILFLTDLACAVEVELGIL